MKKFARGETNEFVRETFLFYFRSDISRKYSLELNPRRLQNPIFTLFVMNFCLGHLSDMYPTTFIYTSTGVVATSFRGPVK